MNRNTKCLFIAIGTIAIIIAACRVCNTNDNLCGESIGSSSASPECIELQPSYTSELFDVYRHQTNSKLEKVASKYLSEAEARQLKLLFCDYLDLVGDVFGMVVMDGGDCEVVLISEVDEMCEVKVVRFYKDGFSKW